MLDDLCKSPCGPAFNKVTADWRSWCAANRKDFVADPGAHVSEPTGWGLYV